MAFKPALLVVGMQNDFLLAPGGPILSPANGMDLVGPQSNSLLSMPGFAMRINGLERDA